MWPSPLTLAIAILLLAVPTVAGASVTGHRDGPLLRSAPANAVKADARTALQRVKPVFVRAPQALGIPSTAEIAGAAAVHFHPDQGLEVDAADGVAVEAGHAAPDTVGVEQAQAQRVWTGVGNAALTGPWGSGKPGSTHKLWLLDYPAGWMNQLLGWSLDGRRSAFAVLVHPTATGEAKYSINLKIPAEAAPGCGYDVDVMHVNGGPLTLDTWFQVCTLQATNTKVGKGSAVRFSGIIPCRATPGPRPARWPAGRTRARPPSPHEARDRLAARGRLEVRRHLRDGRARPVPGDAWCYPAYTSPPKITVK